MQRTVKFELEIDVTKSNQTDALNNLLKAIGGQTEAGSTSAAPAKEEAKPEPEAKEETKPEPPAKKKRRTKAEIEADKAEVEAEVDKAEMEVSKEDEGEEAEVDKVEAEEIDFTDVRALFAKKLQEGDETTREESIAKLKELGAPNLPGLKPIQYGDFVSFLKGL
jgi:hypothetical protein